MNLQNSKFKGQPVCARDVSSLQVHTSALILYWWFIMKEISLTKGRVALVDDEDFEKINKWKWHAVKPPNSNTYYAIRHVRRRRETPQLKAYQMGRDVLNMKHNDKRVTDHIDRNGLNNQKYNLRICTHAQNMCNRAWKKHSSKYKGVSLIKNRKYKKWMATIAKNKKNYFLGTFYNEEEAAMAYNNKALELHGDFAKLNEV